MSSVFITDGDRPLGVALSKYFRANGFDVKCHAANGNAASIIGAITANDGIKILINNAEPVFERLPFEDIDEVNFTNMLSCVARSAFFAMQAVQPIIKRNGGGKIINISSSAPVRGMLGGSHFSAAKGSLYSFTRSWAQELAPDKIRVNLVSADVQMGTAVEDGGGKTPLGRPVSLEDIIATVAFLSGPGGDMISGQEIIVDGGFTKTGF